MGRLSSAAATVVTTKRKCPELTASNIVPIRVDVLSEDKSIRVVDTLLFDPTCWPVTLYQPLYAAVEENVTQMAHNILSDAEVQGMGRTVRHFTGRLDLWSPKLQKAVEDQLRPQLWKIATIDPENLACPTPIPQKHKDGGDSSNNNHDTTVGHLVPISIRLMIDRVVVHEDILWDHHGRVSPFEFAQDMAEELNLPDEVTIAIAMTIVEQLHGLEIDTTPDPTLSNNSNNNSSSSNNNNSNSNNTSNNTSAIKSSRGAWIMDSKEHASITTQIIAQHRSI